MLSINLVVTIREANSQPFLLDFELMKYLQVEFKFKFCEFKFEFSNFYKVSAKFKQFSRVCTLNSGSRKEQNQARIGSPFATFFYSFGKLPK